MHVAMVTITFVHTSKSILFITSRCSSYEWLRCEVFVKYDNQCMKKIFNLSTYFWITPPIASVVRLLDFS